jgi:hypothetical protein
VAIRDRLTELSKFERRPAEWREAVLQTLEQEFGNDLDRIWELLKGGTDKSLVEDMTRQELAIGAPTRVEDVYESPLGLSLHQ